MKRSVLFLVIIAMMLSLAACGKRCFDCGKLTGRGYTAFGNYYCEDCFW